MAHNPTLKSFTIILQPQKEGIRPTFKELTSKLKNEKYEENEDPGTIFLDFFGLFLDELRRDEFYVDKRKYKGFTAYNLEPTDGSQQSITPHSAKFVIEGVIEGGRYGQKRGVSKIEQKTDKGDVLVNQIITDQYYFYLHAPLDSDTAILLLQSYTEDSIADIFLAFLCKIFKAKGFTAKAKSQTYVAKSVIEQYRKKSVAKIFKYSKRYVLTDNVAQPFEDDDTTFTVRIEIESGTGIKIERVPFWRKYFSKKKLDINSVNDVTLGEYPDEKVVLRESDGPKRASWDVKNSIEIEPTQYLEGIIDLNEDNIPNFVQLKEYCIKLMEELKDDVYGKGGVNRPNI